MGEKQVYTYAGSVMILLLLGVFGVTIMEDRVIVEMPSSKCVENLSLIVHDDYTKLKCGRFVVAEWKEYVDYYRTYGEPDKWVQNNRKKTKIQVIVLNKTEESFVVRKTVPYYKSTRGSDGILTIDYTFSGDKVKWSYDYKLTGGNKAKHRVRLKLLRFEEQYGYNFVPNDNRYLYNIDNTYYYGDVTGDIFIDPIIQAESLIRIGGDIVDNWSFANMTISPENVTCNRITGKCSQQMTVCSKYNETLYLFGIFDFSASDINSYDPEIRRNTTYNDTEPTYGWVEHSLYCEPQYDGNWTGSQTNIGTCYYWNEANQTDVIVFEHHCKKTPSNRTCFWDEWEQNGTVIEEKWQWVWNDAINKFTEKNKNGSTYYFNKKGLQINPGVCKAWRFNYYPTVEQGKWNAHLALDPVDDWHCIINNSCFKQGVIDPWWTGGTDWNKKRDLNLTCYDTSCENVPVTIHLSNQSWAGDFQADYCDLRITINETVNVSYWLTEKNWSGGGSTDVMAATFLANITVNGTGDGYEAYYNATGKSCVTETIFIAYADGEDTQDDNSRWDNNPAPKTDTVTQGDFSWYRNGWYSQSFTSTNEYTCNSLVYDASTGNQNRILISIRAGGLLFYLGSRDSNSGTCNPSSSLYCYYDVPNWFTTGVSQGTGWHNVKLSMDANGYDCWIDDAVACTDVGAQESASIIRIDDDGAAGDRHDYTLCSDRDFNLDITMPTYSFGAEEEYGAATGWTHKIFGEFPEKVFGILKTAFTKIMGLS